MPSKTTSAAAAPSEDAIRMRAYFMWEAAGCPDGAADYYWGLAAAELVSGSARKPKRVAAMTAPTATSARPKATKAAANPTRSKKTKSKKS